MCFRESLKMTTNIGHNIYTTNSYVKLTKWICFLCNVIWNEIFLTNENQLEQILALTLENYILL